MPKLYYPSPDELQRATPLNEQLWFPRYQDVLLKLANTGNGRALLCIDPWEVRPFPIVKFRKNMVTYYRGRWHGRDHYLSDVRIGAKWGNVIRFRWLEVKKAMDRIALLDMLSWQSLGSRIPAHAYRFTTTTVYPDPNPENTSVDGVSVENTNSDWATIRAAAGDGGSDTVSNQEVASFISNASVWTQMTRGHFVFDATAIVDTDTLDSATFEVVCSAKRDNYTGQGTSLVESRLASPTAVANSDYANLQSTKLAADVLNTAITANDSTYNVFTLNASGEALVNFDAVTKLGTLGTSDLDDDEPTITFDYAYNITVRMAETSGTTQDPKLVILHTAAVAAPIGWPWRLQQAGII